MASVEPETIIAVLKLSGELSIDELVEKVQEKCSTASTTTSAVTATAVKSAVLPLISAGRIDLTRDWNLHLPSKARS